MARKAGRVPGDHREDEGLLGFSAGLEATEYRQPATEISSSSPPSGRELRRQSRADARSSYSSISRPASDIDETAISPHGNLIFRMNKGAVHGLNVFPFAGPDTPLEFLPQSSRTRDKTRAQYSFGPERRATLRARSCRVETPFHISTRPRRAPSGHLPAPLEQFECGKNMSSAGKFDEDLSYFTLSPRSIRYGPISLMT